MIDFIFKSTIIGDIIFFFKILIFDFDICIKIIYLYLILLS